MTFRIPLAIMNNYGGHPLELTLEVNQIPEAVSALFHTLFLHRTSAKLHIVDNQVISGKLGMSDVECDFIDLTYVRVSSELLAGEIQTPIQAFKDALHATKATNGEITLEYFTTDHFRSWEIWPVKVTIVTPSSESERQQCRKNVSKQVAEKIIFINKEINKHRFIPRMYPNDLKMTYETNFTDVTPYAYKIDWKPKQEGSTILKSIMSYGNFFK